MSGVINWLDIHFGAVHAVATIVLVLVTAAYVYLTWRLVTEIRKQRRPHVWVDIVANGALYLIVSNSGDRIATDVKFQVIEDIPVPARRGRGLLDDVDILRQGFTLIPPGREHRYLLVQNGTFQVEPEKQKLTLRIWYKGEGIHYEEEFAFDLALLLRPFIGTPRLV